MCFWWKAAARLQLPRQIRAICPHDAVEGPQHQLRATMRYFPSGRQLGNNPSPNTDAYRRISRETGLWETSTLAGPVVSDNQTLRALRPPVAADERLGDFAPAESLIRETGSTSICRDNLKICSDVCFFPFSHTPFACVQSLS